MSRSPLRLERLTSEDEERLWARLRADEPANIFPIPDLEHFGWDSPLLSFHGVFREGELVGHLMRFGANASLACDVPAAVPFVQAWLRRERVRYVNGVRRYVEPVLAAFETDQVVRQEDSALALLKRDSFRPHAVDRSPGRVYRATSDDLDGATRAHVAAPDEFTQLDFEERRGTLRAVLTDGWRRLFVAQAPDGTVAAAAQTIAEGAELAVVGGVVTDPAYRGQGYATACTAALCAELLDEGKRVYLFYSKGNVPAARAYASIGFEVIADWVLAELRIA